MTDWSYISSKSPALTEVAIVADDLSMGHCKVVYLTVLQVTKRSIPAPCQAVQVFCIKNSLLVIFSQKWSNFTKLARCFQSFFHCSSQNGLWHLPEMRKVTLRFEQNNVQSITISHVIPSTYVYTILFISFLHTHKIEETVFFLHTQNVRERGKKSIT